MRRRDRKLLTQLSLIAAGLLFFIWLASGQSNKTRLFSWKVVRYKTNSKTPPRALGQCPRLSSSTKPALVVARVTSDDDPQWLEPLAAKYHLCIYRNDLSASDTVPPSNEIPVPRNRGNEAMSYLTFITDNYADIPEAGAVFIHGARRAWHNDARDYDNLKLLSALNISSALEPTGYHNLRCDWSAGTCDPNAMPKVPPPSSFETRITAVLEPYNKRAVSDAALPAAFEALFGDGSDKYTTKLGSSDYLRAQCCAQFVVSRERIRQHSRDEYVALRQWLLDDGAAPRDDKVAGRIISYLWHVLFLPHSGAASVLDPQMDAVHLDELNALACPSAADCYCRLYNRCGLETCRHPGYCYGEYMLPKDYKVPRQYLDDLS